MNETKIEHLYRMKEIIAFCQGYFSATDKPPDKPKIIGKLEEVSQYIHSQINEEKQDFKSKAEKNS